ncbi:Fdx4 [Desulfamplus magnetovallimortis]|uniref:Fdx4 n=1 Tax=Desulfamplus magnetovallimortis TaxID=1246637 RepID=A0A1W1H609_9BACT|nr:4Fe-4S dicluster domain-containing protein [Desulfamplus magnetovallimortis]SLM27887.1 Fdx4 [Desulfamplus magnetovallimortis]
MSFFITKECTGCMACLLICPSQAIKGEKKEPHTIQDELCIDCGACGRVCAFQAVLDNFGDIASRIPKKDWDRPVFNLDTCISCNICTDTCPTNALESKLQKPKNLHTYPWLAREKDCIACGFCALECPVDAIEMKKENEGI